MPRARIQEFVAVDFSRDMMILALTSRHERDIVVGLSQYSINESDHTAELALVVRDDYQSQGVGDDLPGQAKRTSRVHRRSAGGQPSGPQLD